MSLYSHELLQSRCAEPPLSEVNYDVLIEKDL
jgi:hypothetical protein